MASRQAAPARPDHSPPPADAFRVLDKVPEGLSITPYLRLQLDRAWAFDEARRARFDAIRTGWSPSSLYRASGAPDVRRLRLVPYDPSKSDPEAIAWEAAGSTEHEGVVIDRYRSTTAAVWCSRSSTSGSAQARAKKP